MLWGWAMHRGGRGKLGPDQRRGWRRAELGKYLLGHKYSDGRDMLDGVFNHRWGEWDDQLDEFGGCGRSELRDSHRVPGPNEQVLQRPNGYHDYREFDAGQREHPGDLRGILGNLNFHGGNQCHLTYERHSGHLGR